MIVAIFAFAAWFVDAVHSDSVYQAAFASTGMFLSGTLAAVSLLKDDE
jgi:hypothetical protein